MFFNDLAGYLHGTFGSANHRRSLFPEGKKERHFHSVDFLVQTMDNDVIQCKDTGYVRTGTISYYHFSDLL